MVEDVCSIQQTQCPSGADFIFVGERGLERLLQRESSSQQTQCPSGADFIFVGERGLERLLQRERIFDSNASIFVDVHLLSGKRAAVEVDADASVESLKHTLQQISKRGNPVHSPDWSDPVLKLQGSAVIVGLVMLYFFGLDWASMKSYPPPGKRGLGVPIVLSPCSMCDSPYRFAQSRVQVLFPPQGRVSGPVCMHVCIPISPQTSPDLVGCECPKCRDA